MSSASVNDRASDGVNDRASDSVNDRALDISKVCADGKF